jgi:hypothetical protein
LKFKIDENMPKEVGRAMRLLPLEPVAEALWIVEEDRVWIRK